MPQPRKHDSHAKRQAAYRQRQAQALAEQLQQQHCLPPLPVIASIPGWPRWRQAMAAVERHMQSVEAEMQDYYDERSERWQESERAEEFEQKLDELRAALEIVAQWNENAL